MENTLSAIIEGAIEELNDRIENYDLLDEPYADDQLHEIADGAVPIYTADVFEVAANSPDARQVEDTGLLGGDKYDPAEKQIQVAIYEQVSNALHTRIHEARTERGIV